MEWRVWLAQYREQVNTKFLSTVTVIIKVLCNWWPIKIIYFHRDMLFNSVIQPLISSSYKSPNHNYIWINKRTIMMEGGNVFMDRCQIQFCVEDNTYIGWKIALLYSSWNLLGKFITNSTQPRETQINRESLYWSKFEFFKID